ncbi:MAG: hypothetical protein Q7J85_09680 [Bacillota bacterium]|nr:hypothetical protein [Bacillota bacterium]
MWDRWYYLELNAGFSYFKKKLMIIENIRDNRDICLINSLFFLERVLGMNNQLFEKPILNSPYEYPARHWELDEQRQSTQRILNNRRRAEFITPIPKPKRRKGAGRRSLDHTPQQHLSPL